MEGVVLVRTRTVVALGTVAVAVGAAAIWLSLDDDGGAATTVPINELTGAYRGVRFGASEEDVVRIFGKPDRSDGVAPAGTTPADVGVPQSLPGYAQLLKYEDVVFLVGSARGVYAFLTTEHGATTSRGVSIGDDMDAAHERYRLRCRGVAGGESLVGGEEFYPSCEARVGESVRMWFGRDTIRSITVLSTWHLQE